jgi:hypothetical protein
MLFVYLFAKNLRLNQSSELGEITVMPQNIHHVTIIRAITEFPASFKLHEHQFEKILVVIH